MKGDDLLDKLDKLMITGLCVLLALGILLTIPFVIIMFRMAFS